MLINRLSGVFRRGCSAGRGNAAQDEEELQIATALMYLLEHGKLHGFPGSRNERLALMTTAIRRGLVAWDRLRERYVLSALGQRHVYAPQTTSMRPEPTRDKSKRVGRAGRLMRPGIAVTACLGLVTMVSTGAPRIASYFADAMPTATEALSLSPSVPAGDGAGTWAAVASPSLTLPEHGAKLSRRQGTAMEQSDEPATLETCGQREFKAVGTTTRTVVVSGLIACAGRVTPGEEERSQSRMDAITTTTAKEADLDVRGTSRAMGEAAARLKGDPADWDRKLQQLEADLGGNVREIVLILQGAADELAPEADYRTILARAAEGIRSSANQAVAENRQKAPYLREKVAQLETVSRDAEELRTNLVKDIDVLEQFKDRMQLVGVKGRVREVVKSARTYLKGVKAIATRTERLATELYNYEGGVAQTDQVAPPSSTASAPKPVTGRPLLTVDDIRP
jgi:hypothetical protein